MYPHRVKKQSIFIIISIYPKGKMTAQQREEEMKKIKTDYDKVINESNEKIHIAEDCYG